MEIAFIREPGHGRTATFRPTSEACHCTPSGDDPDPADGYHPHGQPKGIVNPQDRQYSVSIRWQLIAPTVI